MAIRTRAHARDDQRSEPRRRRFRRAPRPVAAGYRAVTLGPGHDDWAVVGPGGDVVFRGYMLYAARMASELTRVAA